MSTSLTFLGFSVPNALSERMRLAGLPAVDCVADEVSLSGAQPNLPQPMFDLIELFFFAYRDFVSDADRMLADYAFGRAHHRVLHFVTRQPGLTVAELLELLRITKQSLNRVMKDLVDQGFIETRPGVADRRHRLLFATGKGRRLALELAAVQSRRFERVLAGLPAGAREVAAQFLLAVVDPQDRDTVRARLSPNAPPARLAVAGGRSP